MATITATLEKLRTFGDDARVFTWAALTTTDNYGSPVELPGWSDRSIQLLGTLSTGGAVTMYGSNKASPTLTDDVDWSILTDPQGNNIALSTLKIEQILEVTRWIRPKITGGDGSTSLNVHLLLSKSGGY